MKRAFGIVGLAAALLVACSRLTDAPEWWDQLEADSPCYRVDLLDGLDTRGTAEVDDLFACLNRHGHLEPLQPVHEALHWDARSGDPAAIELARTFNAMARARLDPLGLAGLLADAVRAEDAPYDALIDLFLELAYADRASRVRSGAIALTSAEDLASGVLVPLAPVVPAAAGALLDDEAETAAWVGGWIGAEETKRWVRTAEAWATSDDPTVAEPVGALIAHLGAAWQAAADGGNDRWGGASGRSLRDVLDVWWLRDRDPVLVAIADEAAFLLDDAALREAIGPALLELHGAGHLAGLPPQVVWLTTVDARGAPRAVGEGSALEAFVRLLARANGPVDCLGVYSTDNLAVDVLRVLADLDPDTTLAGLEVVAWVTDQRVTDQALEEAIDLGVCEGIDRALLDDLDAVAVVVAPEADHLLPAFVRALALLKDEAHTDRLPVLADLVQDLHEAGGYPPVEELLRDVGDAPLVLDLVDLVPVVVDPAAHGLSAGPAPAVGLHDVLDLLAWVFTTDEALGLTGWERARPLVAPVLAEDGAWTALDRLSALMVDDRTQTSRLLDLLPPLLALDPELALLDQLGALLSDPALREPALRLAETPQVAASLLVAEPAEGQTEVPLAFAARLTIGGTLDDVLDLLELLVG